MYNTTATTYLSPGITSGSKDTTGLKWLSSFLKMPAAKIPNINQLSFGTTCLLTLNAFLFVAFPYSTQNAKQVCKLTVEGQLYEVNFR